MAANATLFALINSPLAVRFLTIGYPFVSLFSIAYANHQEITVLAPGQDDIAPAFLKALGLAGRS
jgi:hypothetical protein